MKHLQKILASALALSLMFACIPVYADGLQDGVYTQAEQGFQGDVTVTVVVEDGKIANVELDGPNETEGVGLAALPILQAQIMEKQSADIDAVAGATITSNAVKAATEKALAEAAGESVSTAAELTDGTYTGIGNGYHGQVPVSVTLENGRIAAISVGEIRKPPEWLI